MCGQGLLRCEIKSRNAEIKPSGLNLQKYFCLHKHHRSGKQETVVCPEEIIVMATTLVCRVRTAVTDHHGNNNFNLRFNVFGETQVITVKLINNPNKIQINQ